MPNYTEPNFNKTIIHQLRGVGISDPEFVPCALGRPITNSLWNMIIPEIAECRWKKPNFRLVIHAQDFVHWYNNELCVELHWIEKQFTEEQQRKIIFVHWDHSLRDWYEGHIQCVEFASHSYELVHQLRSRWDEWKDVLNKDYEYNFICLNGRSRQYRDKVYQLLQNKPNSYVTHGIHNPFPSHPYTDYNFNNVDNFIKMMPLYQKAKASMVTETIYEDHPGIITEKTLLAIAAKHPFMCIGHLGIHYEIAERGFKNYDDLFDLTYDVIEKEYRLEAAIQLNLGRLTSNYFNINKVKDKIEYNFDFLMSNTKDGYTKSIEQRAYKQLQEIVF